MKQALGILEISGLAFTIACADTAVKSADVELLGYETSRCGGKFVLKFTGNVGSAQAAVDAALALTAKNEIEAVGYVIPRPAEGCWEMVQKENGLMRKGQNPAESKEPETDSKEEPEVTEEETETAGQEKPEAIREEAEVTGEEPEAVREEPEIDRAEPEAAEEEAIIDSETEGEAPEAKDEAPAAETSGEETDEILASLGQKVQEPTCNICGDIKCPRRKGEPHSRCIHRGEERK